MYSRLLVVLSLLLVTSVTQLTSADVPIIQYGDRFHPTVGHDGMVVSQERLASQVGADILANGGNAIDAAVATGFALAVTLPQAGNLGGGGFMVIYLADTQKAIAVDYREMAPAAASRDMFLNDQGEADPEKSRYSALAVGVPGTVAGLVQVQEKYGKLPLKEVLKPAITLAEKGFEVTYPLSYSLQFAQQRLQQQDAAKNYFLNPDGSPLNPGQLWKQKDLAATLKRIARYGDKDFYQGKTANLIVEEMQRSGGLISLEDLASYQVVEREPVVGHYRGYDIVSMPPPSSGGVHLVQMLNILEGWELASLGHNSAAYLHRLAETMRRAYADRSKYLGDPDFTPVPVTQLIDKKYAEALRAEIKPDRATPSANIHPGLAMPEESPQTTHFAVWDSEGNVVSNTYTLNFSYGNAMAVSGAGFLLNNEMDDFSAKPGVANAYGLVGDKANAIEPRKRPLSSMTPTLVLRDGKPVLATGSPGGSRIITTVLQLILNTVDFEMNLAEATAAPRIHHQWLPDQLQVENGISVDTQTILKSFGHDVAASPWSIGRSQSISHSGEFFYGVSDYRWPGGGAVPAAE